MQPEVQVDTFDARGGLFGRGFGLINMNLNKKYRSSPVPHEESPVPHEESPVPHEESPVPHEEGSCLSLPTPTYSMPLPRQQLCVGMAKVIELPSTDTSSTDTVSRNGTGTQSQNGVDGKSQNGVGEGTILHGTGLDGLITEVTVVKEVYCKAIDAISDGTFPPTMTSAFPPTMTSAFPPTMTSGPCTTAPLSRDDVGDGKVVDIAVHGHIYTINSSLLNRTDIYTGSSENSVTNRAANRTANLIGSHPVPPVSHSAPPGAPQPPVPAGAFSELGIRPTETIALRVPELDLLLTVDEDDEEALLGLVFAPGEMTAFSGRSNC